MNLNDLQIINTARANRWHEGDFKSWSGSDWATALAGEVGEACNIVKKLNRVRDSLRGNKFSEHEVKEGQDLINDLGYELADAQLYLCLLASRFDINLTDYVRSKFNQKSEEMGFPERL